MMSGFIYDFEWTQFEMLSMLSTNAAFTNWSHEQRRLTVMCVFSSFVWEKEIINSRCIFRFFFFLRSPLTFSIYWLCRSTGNQYCAFCDRCCCLVHMNRKDLTRTNRFCSLLIFETFARLIHCRFIYIFTESVLCRRWCIATATHMPRDVETIKTDAFTRRMSIFSAFTVS